MVGNIRLFIVRSCAVASAGFLLASLMIFCIDGFLLVNTLFVIVLSTISICIFAYLEDKLLKMQLAQEYRRSYGRSTYHY